MSTTGLSPETADAHIAAISQAISLLKGESPASTENLLLRAAFQVLCNRHAILPDAMMTIKREDGSVREQKFFYKLDHEKL